MADKEFEATVRRVFPAPRDVVWALVADTNRWDRAFGLSAASYRWRENEGKRERVGAAREGGFELEWIEPPYEWAEGYFVDGRRAFIKGPLTGGGLRVRLQATNEGTEVVASAYVTGGGLVKLAGTFLRGRERRALEAYMDAIGKVLLEATGRGPIDAGSEPAIVKARRALVSTPYEALTSGLRTPSNLSELEARAARLRRAPVPPEMAELLITTLRDRPDEEISQIRPFELGRTWGRDRRALLKTFLHATRAGLVDLRWQINCPICRVAAGSVSSLDELEREAHCDACNIPYDVDFAAHVEAVFQCSRAIRPVEAQVFCASSPSFLPHVYAQLSVPGAGVRRARMGLPEGSLLIRGLRSAGRTELEVDRRPASMRVEVGEATVRVACEGEADASGETEVVLVSTDGREHTVLFERSGWSADAVFGTTIATFPDFLDLFAAEAPRTGADIAIGELALLFTDLTGSTAMYGRLGDARAFAVVQEHFREMEKVVVASGGAVVKTMGDAVMASFASLEDAVRAAVEMVRANEARHGPLGLGVKVGVYSGPCLMVRANDRLDFFGSTVNLAARLQARAESAEVVLMASDATRPELAPLLAGNAARFFSAELKGIEGEQALVAYKIGA